MLSLLKLGTIAITVTTKLSRATIQPDTAILFSDIHALNWTREPFLVGSLAGADGVSSVAGGGDDKSDTEMP